MNTAIPASLLPLLDAWKAPQVGLPKAIRWSQYLDGDEGVRKQDSLQHSLALSICGAIMMAQLQPYMKVEVDHGLLVTAFNVHDIGEGELEKDTLYIDKTTVGDLEEYLAFRRRYEPLGAIAFEPLHRAFLLQFARKNPSVFPDDARGIMKEIQDWYLAEMLIFEAVERWDYFLYAAEQHNEARNEKILVHVLRHQVPHFDRLAIELPGFREEIWTEGLSSWATGVLQLHEGKWIETKSKS